MQISQQALYASTLSNQNYTFIHPPPPASLLHRFAFICFPHISKSLFIGIYQGFYHFSYKKDGEYFPSFLQCCPFMEENWRNFRSLLFFPDSHISMSLLGLSLPSQWIWSSEDQALERQRAPAAPTSPHPSLYTSLSLLIPLFLFIPHLAWLFDILILPVDFDLASSRDSGDCGIWQRYCCF